MNVTVLIYDSVTKLPDEAQGAVVWSRDIDYFGVTRQWSDNLDRMATLNKFGVSRQDDFVDATTFGDVVRAYKSDFHNTLVYHQGFRARTRFNLVGKRTLISALVAITGGV